MVLLVQITVNLHSKRLGRKGNLHLKDIIFGPTISILIYFYISFKGISIHGKN